MYVDLCALVATLGLCMRRAGSDLNPNHLLVFIVLCTVKSLAVMSPTFPLAPGASCLRLVSSCADGVQKEDSRYGSESSN